MRIKMFTLAGLLLLSLPSFALETYKIDQAHTSLVFKVSHLGFSNTYGQIPKVDGKIVFDDKKPANSTIEVTADLNSLTTHVEKRDKHLKTADFFDVKQFPKVSFKSTSVKKAKGDTYEVKGQLTLHGVTKPISFTFNRMRTGKDPWGNTRTGGEAEFKIKRSDYGMNFMQGPEQVGDEVTIIISAEGILEKAS